MNSIETAERDSASADAGARVYFVSLKLRDEVHAQALGFTRLIFELVWAPDAAAAEQTAREFVAGLGNEVRRLAGIPSLGKEQSVARYTFPEQILGLPSSLLEEASPGDAKAVEIHRKRQALILAGRRTLASAAQEAVALVTG